MVSGRQIRRGKDHIAENVRGEPVDTCVCTTPQRMAVAELKELKLEKKIIHPRNFLMTAFETNLKFFLLSL